MTKLSALAAALLAAGAVLAPAAPAGADRGAAACAGPGIPLDDPSVLWPQLSLAPQRVWPFTIGTEITVAVLDSGVDAHHPQLAGRVAQGYDAVGGGGRADSDCLGTGTQVAGVIAAAAARAGGFSGLAPGVTILPVRVLDPDSPVGRSVDTAVLAEGIEAAVDRHAAVIAIPTVAYNPDNRLRDAVARAVGEGVTVVAAVGDLGDELAGNPTPYPAFYPGVIGVGAIDVTGALWPSSQHGDFVDLVAPGVAVPTLQTGSGMTLVGGGTGVAAGFVAATAALARARWGDELPADRVDDLLTGTATPAATGRFYGHGIVNPYAAVTNQLVETEPEPLPGLAAPNAPRAQDAAWHGRDLALVGSALALATAGVAVLIAVAVPRGRRRFWRGTLARRDTTPREPEEPGPPLQLFDEKATTARGG